MGLIHLNPIKDGEIKQRKINVFFENFHFCISSTFYYILIKKFRCFPQNLILRPMTHDVKKNISVKFVPNLNIRNSKINLKK